MKSFILRNKFTYGILVIVAIITVSVWNYLTIPTYRSTAVIRVEGTNGTADANLVAAEITSKSFISNALSDQGINIEYFIKTDYRTFAATYASPYTVDYKITGKNFKYVSYDIKIYGNTSYTLTREEYGKNKSINAELGQTISDRDISITVTKKKNAVDVTGLITDPTYSFTVYSNDDLAQIFDAPGRNLTTQIEGGLIHLSCDHPSSITSKKIVDALVNQYSNNKKRTHDQTAINSISHIDKQINSVVEQLDKSQNEAVEFKENNNLIDFNRSSEAALNRLQNLQMQKVELELQMVALDNISMYLRKNRAINNSMVDYGTITDPLFTENVQELGAKYREKETLNKNGTDATQIDIQIELLKESIAESVLNTRKKTFIKIEELNDAIYGAQSAIKKFPAVERQLASIQRKVDLDQIVYNRLVEKRAEAIINSTLPGIGIIVLQPAVMPTEPYLPNVPQNTGLAVALSLLLATGIGLSRKKKSIRIKTRAELEKETSIPFLGNITSTETDNSTSFTDLCTRLLMKNDSGECQVITTTSTLGGEGKTFVTTNLAKSMASIDKKVLMIDMNTKQLDLEKLFDVRLDRNLADVLEGSVDVHEAIGITSFPNLEVISAGNLKSGINTLLSSRKKNQILDQLKKHYDIIFIDTPEAGRFIDAVPLMKMSDLSLYVIRAVSASGEQLTNAELIRKDYNVANMYVVLNSVKSTSTHVGLEQKGRLRKLHNYEGPKISGEGVGILRKIALWFY